MTGVTILVRYGSDKLGFIQKTQTMMLAAGPSQLAIINQVLILAFSFTRGGTLMPGRSSARGIVSSIIVVPICFPMIASALPDEAIVEDPHPGLSAVRFRPC